MKVLYNFLAVLLFFYPINANAEMDTVTCMFLKEKYADCLKSEGWTKPIWYDFFGKLRGTNDTGGSYKPSREALSTCNSLSLTIKEERC